MAVLHKIVSCATSAVQEGVPASGWEWNVGASPKVPQECCGKALHHISRNLQRMCCSSSGYRDRPDRNDTRLLAEQIGMTHTRNVSCSACCLFHAGVSPGLLVSPEDGGDMLLRNVGGLSTDYTAYVPEDNDLQLSPFLTKMLIHWSQTTANRICLKRGYNSGLFVLAALLALFLW
jgi:hypothetical protein